MASILWLFEIIISAAAVGMLAAALALCCRIELRRRRVWVCLNCPEPPSETEQRNMERLDERVTERLFLTIGLPLALFLEGLIPPVSGPLAFLISSIALSICALRLLQSLDERHCYRVVFDNKRASTGRPGRFVVHGRDGQPGGVFIFPRQTRREERSAVSFLCSFGHQPMGLLLPGPEGQSKS